MNARLIRDLEREREVSVRIDGGRGTTQRAAIQRLDCHRLVGKTRRELQDHVGRCRRVHTHRFETSSGAAIGLDDVATLYDLIRLRDSGILRSGYVTTAEP